MLCARRALIKNTNELEFGGIRACFKTLTGQSGDMQICDGGRTEGAVKNDAMYAYQLYRVITAIGTSNTAKNYCCAELNKTLCALMMNCRFKQLCRYLKTKKLLNNKPDTTGDDLFKSSEDAAANKSLLLFGGPFAIQRFREHVAQRRRHPAKYGKKLPVGSATAGGRRGALSLRGRTAVGRGVSAAVRARYATGQGAASIRGRRGIAMRAGRSVHASPAKASEGRRGNQYMSSRSSNISPYRGAYPAARNNMSPYKAGAATSPRQSPYQRPAQPQYHKEMQAGYSSMSNMADIGNAPRHHAKASRKHSDGGISRYERSYNGGGDGMQPRSRRSAGNVEAQQYDRRSSDYYQADQQYEDNRYAAGRDMAPEPTINNLLYGLTTVLNTELSKADEQVASTVSSKHMRNNSNDAMDYSRDSYQGYTSQDASYRASQSTATTPQYDIQQSLRQAYDSQYQQPRKKEQYSQWEDAAPSAGRGYDQTAREANTDYRGKYTSDDAASRGNWLGSMPAAKSQDYTARQQVAGSDYEYSDHHAARGSVYDSQSNTAYDRHRSSSYTAQSTAYGDQSGAAYGTQSTAASYGSQRGAAYGQQSTGSYSSTAQSAAGNGSWPARAGEALGKKNRNKRSRKGGAAYKEGANKKTRYVYNY